MYRSKTRSAPRRRIQPTASKRRVGAVPSAYSNIVGVVARQPRRVSPSTIPAQSRSGFMNKSYTSSRIGMPNTSSEIIRKSYSTFSKDKDYEKKKALDFFSAIKNSKYALPMPNSLGVFSTANFSRRQQVNTTTVAGNSVYVVITFTQSQICGFTYQQVGTTATAVAAITSIFFPDMDSNAPQNMRNSRMTLTILNTTASTNVAGAISTIFVNNGLEYEFSASTTAVELTAAFQNEIATMLDTNTKSRIHGSANFIGDKENQQFHIIPSSMANLEDWATYGNGTFDVASTKNALINGARAFTHSTLICRFESTSVVNNYTLLINGQYALRWPANSILSSIGQNDQKTYVNKNLVENMSAKLNGDGHMGGGAG
jgi:hypothetical protein